jgi:hypothetical protein
MVFCFKGQLYFLIAAYAISGLFLFLGLAIETGRQGTVTFGEPIMFGGFLLFSILGTISFLDQSDIVVDDQGISRCILGWPWKKIRWDNVRLITAFPVSGGPGYSARAFNIFPIVKPQFRLLPSGKILFNDKVQNASTLVELLNQYALKHGIKIETRDTLWSDRKPTNRL